MNYNIIDGIIFVSVFIMMVLVVTIFKWVIDKPTGMDLIFKVNVIY